MSTKVNSRNNTPSSATSIIRPRSRNSFSGFCADEPGRIDSPRYQANSRITTGTVSRYSMRYFIRNTASTKVEASA